MNAFVRECSGAAGTTPAFEMVAYGTPIPQGSKRIGRHRATGKPILLADNDVELAAWRSAVRNVAEWGRLRYQLTTLDEPVRVRLTFTMPKPASAPKRTRTWPHTKPDVDKLQRAVFDSLVDAKILREDSRVQYVSAEKVWPNEPSVHGEALERPGVQIAVWRIGGS